MSKKFTTIISDCPWGFDDKISMSDVKRGAEANYSTMSIDNICSMRVQDLANPSGAVLALWVPSSILSDGIKVMNAWGFSLKQNWIWVKTKKDPFKELRKIKDISELNNKLDNFNFDSLLSFGMGRLGRNVHEVALIGTRGKIYNKLKNKSQRTVFFYENTKHSKKPEILQDRLELMFPNNDPNVENNYIEIFARRQRPGWTCIGNEIDGLDIHDAIAKLL